MSELFLDVRCTINEIKNSKIYLILLPMIATLLCYYYYQKNF